MLRQGGVPLPADRALRLAAHHDVQPVLRLSAPTSQLSFVSSI